MNERIMKADFDNEDESDGEDNEFTNLLEDKEEEETKDKRIILINFNIMKNII